MIIDFSTLKKCRLFKRSVEADKAEYCVICTGETGYVFSTPVQNRKYYVEGCGQLCESCYRDAYASVERERK